MQGQVIGVTSLAAAVSITIVLALAAGFGVGMAQAVSQSLPVILVGGTVVALTTLILGNELA